MAVGLSCKQSCIVSRLLYAAYNVGPLGALFCTLTERSPLVGKEEKSDHTLPALDDSQAHSFQVQQDALSKPGRSMGNNKKSKHKNGVTESQVINVRRCGKVMTSMLHKTYWSMKDRKLVTNEETNDGNEASRSNSSVAILQTPDLLNLEKTFYPSKKKFSKDLRKQYMVQTSQREGSKCNLGVKELFYQGMYFKYQDPSAEEAASLAQRYPNPEQIFKDVIYPLMEAKGQNLPDPDVSSHLRQVYWKACLTLPWSRGVTATHPEKNIAIHNVYFKACEQLEKLGLMWHDEEDQWQPMSCEKVVSMLETLAKYIESSFAASKGRGFKIILNRMKNNTPCDNSIAITPECKEKEGCKTNITESHSRRLVQTWHANLTKDKNILRQGKATCSLNIFENGKLKHIDKVYCETDSDANFHNVSQCQNSNDSHTHDDQVSPKMQMQFFKDSTGVPQTGRPRAQWMCTVHVGWPFPFTVQAQSVSLPGAQMLGYMKVAMKLKAQGLLTRCNSGVSPRVLGRLMLLDIQAHWEKSLHSSWDNTLTQKFAADAELFCDASIAGFGAYLVLKDIGKVRWLCQSWEEHDSMFLDIIYPRKWMFESTLAELYATVTSVNSWKKKLRGKRLLCFSDNQTTVGLINSYMEKPVKEEYCINTLDLLVTSLKTTCLTYSITLQAAWLDRDRNALADLLSRKETRAFRNTVPEAACNKTKAKKLSIPWSKTLA